MNTMMITVPVPSSKIKKLNFRSGTWYNIQVPSCDSMDYKSEWKSFSVKPEQVMQINEKLYLVQLVETASVKLTSYNPDPKQRHVEYVPATMVMGRYLKWFRYVRFVKLCPDSIKRFNLNAPVKAILDDCISTGLKTETYINRIPLML